MLIDQIPLMSNERYEAEECGNCDYSEHCPRDCGTCLKFVHFPQTAPTPRSYNCMRMADYYVCKYSHKYTSELIYALERLRDIRIRPLKVMSVGCGPCTDLYAIDFLQHHNVLGNVVYRGIDLNRVWSIIHDDIKRLSINSEVTFFYRDVFELIDEILRVRWFPDLLIFQYVFSDMQKTCDAVSILGFIEKIAGFINRLPVNSYVVMNDVNLAVGYGGGRDYFDQLYDQLIGCDEISCHFDNINKQRHFEYGEEYDSNALKFDLPYYLRHYSPYETCSSAQKIIKRVR